MTLECFVNKSARPAYSLDLKLFLELGSLREIFVFRIEYHRPDICWISRGEGSGGGGQWADLIQVLVTSVLQFSSTPPVPVSVAVRLEYCVMSQLVLGLGAACLGLHTTG